MSFVKRGNLPELLAPAGSLEHLKAAVSAGADAIYMGGEKFGARAYAQNFSREDMIEALQIAHFHERKLYLTVNTLMKEEELFEELGEFLFPYYENGLDGVIVQDMGSPPSRRRGLKYLSGLRSHLRPKSPPTRRRGLKRFCFDYYIKKQSRLPHGVVNQKIHTPIAILRYFAYTYNMSG